jgi:hypothetical protein
MLTKVVPVRVIGLGEILAKRTIGAWLGRDASDSGVLVSGLHRARLRRIRMVRKAIPRKEARPSKK